MGYTHFWYRTKEIPKESMARIVADFRKLLPVLSARAKIAGWNGEGQPTISEVEVVFNGVKANDNSHETFSFPQVLEPQDYQKPVGGVAYIDAAGKKVCNPKATIGKWFEFCKTARRPYDIYVVAFLVIAKHCLGDSIQVHSDGDLAEWHDGMALVQETLGFGGNFRLDRD
jgi:hypothetical protein